MGGNVRNCVFRSRHDRPPQHAICPVSGEGPCVFLGDDLLPLWNALCQLGVDREGSDFLLPGMSDRP